MFFKYLISFFFLVSCRWLCCHAHSHSICVVSSTNIAYGKEGNSHSIAQCPIRSRSSHCNKWYIRFSHACGFWCCRNLDYIGWKWLAAMNYMVTWAAQCMVLSANYCLFCVRMRFVRTKIISYIVFMRAHSAAQHHLDYGSKRNLIAARDIFGWPFSEIDLIRYKLV